MSKRDKLADEAQADLDRIFPNTARAELPERGYTEDNRGPLIPKGDPKRRRP
jgi:hypothetical protein